MIRNVIVTAIATVTATVTGGCSNRTSHSGAAVCSEALVEALHAATFHFEHGSKSDGRAALARARALAGGANDDTARDVLRRLAVVDGAIDAEPDRARTELESIRVAFGDWKCLPEPLHQRFHAALPPLH